jgi:hypothetical protein
VSNFGQEIAIRIQDKLEWMSLHQLIPPLKIDAWCIHCFFLFLFFVWQTWHMHVKAMVIEHKQLL